MARRLRIDDLYRFALPAEPALSPDGRIVVYTVRTAERDTDRNLSALWRVDTGIGGSGPTQLTHGSADSAPVWSPDGTRLAFLRAEHGPAQVWLLAAATGAARRLTSLPLGAGRPVWSPDGSMIAFTAATDERGDISAPAEPVAPVVIDRLDYQTDGTGLHGTIRAHLYVVDVHTGTHRRLTGGDWSAGQPAWSPDGSRLAFTAPVDASGPLDPDSSGHGGGTTVLGSTDRTLCTAAHVVDVDDPNGSSRLVGPATGSASCLTWTADGQALLVVGRLDTEAGHAGLLRMPLGGGPPADLAAPLDRNVLPGAPAYPGAHPQCSGDGRTVYFCARDRGATHLYAVDLDGGTPRCLSPGAGREVSGVSVAPAAGIAAVVISSATSYGEIATITLAAAGPVDPELVDPELSVHTAHTAAAVPDVDLFTYTERAFTISDGTVVHGWLLTDPARSGARPLLLDIHGGPHNAWSGTADPVHLYHQVLAATGWTVLVLNPRGSDGYGENFFQAVVGAWGEADVQDLLEPLDELVGEGVVDRARITVTGYSYGGFMTCLLTTRDHRFAAAVAGGVVSDFISMAGTSDIAHEISVTEFAATLSAGPDRLMALSPLAQISRVGTPTLVLHGTADLRCPVGQGEQWFSGLRARGVPSQLVLYPQASHLFLLQGRPTHRADYNRRVLAWLQRYAGPAGRRRPAPIDLMPIDDSHWRARLTSLADQHLVPGAALGILRTQPGRDDDLITVSCGVLSTATSVGVSDDAVFQIGSITKVWTTTLALQLVDEGRLELDRPVIDVLPGLRLADAGATAQVSMRHLLTHTSGIAGDVFTDTGRGDDAVARYVAALRNEPQTHPVGGMWSYCNAGFVLAGRVIEELTGMTWDAAIRERLFGPLGLTRAVTLPEEAVLLRAAVGHVDGADGQPVPTQTWGLPRAIGPAGLVTAATADVLAFVRLHLADGLGADGAQLLSAGGVAAMAAEQASLPAAAAADSWGLGWGRYTWSGHRVLGHNGGTIGQASFLRVLPERGLAVVLLTNGGNATDLYEGLFREVFGELAGIGPAPAPTPPLPRPSVDVTKHLGAYERAGAHFQVSVHGDELRLRHTVTGNLAVFQGDPVQEYRMEPVSDDLFLIRSPGLRTWAPVGFLCGPDGRTYLHCGARSTPKVG